MRVYSILIDGGFLKRKLGSAAEPVTPEKIRSFTERLCKHPALLGMTLHRVCYYDALPFTEKRSNPLSGQQINFGTTDVALRNQKLIQAVTRYPFFATRLGETVFRGWQLNKQKLQEKTASPQITKDDLVPAMKFARREGAQLFLVTLNHGIRDILEEHADLMLDLKDCPE